MQQLMERFKNLTSAQQLAIVGGVGVAIILILTAALLSGGDDDDGPVALTTTTTSPATTLPPATTSTAPASTTTTVEEVPDGPAWPLTGEVALAADPTAPILVAKVDNSGSSRPQTGLAEADMVIEVLVEGGVSRFLAFYQSNIPVEIGPVRSVREVDPKLIAPFDVAFAHSGGVDANIDAIRSVATDAGHPVLGSSAYGRDPDRPAPYDLMLNPLPALGLMEAVAREVWFRYETDPPQGDQALTVELDLSTLTQVTYRWSSTDEAYLRFHRESPHTTAAGDQLNADNVIVLFVEELDSGRTDSSGSIVPDYRVVGSGDAVVFRDGVAVTGSWERGSTDGFFRILDEAGQPIALTPGSVWIELTPIGRNLSWR